MISLFVVSNALLVFGIARLTSFGLQAVYDLADYFVVCHHVDGGGGHYQFGVDESCPAIF